MEKVTIELNANWARRVNSPFMHIVGALRGVSVTFAPLFLYWAGAGKFGSGIEWLVVPLCFATIILIPFFYMRLGGAVIRELRKQT